MLSFDEILGQPAAVTALRGLLETGRLPHAFLFHGPAGVGKNTTAMAFARALVCESDEREACGRCSSCGLFASGNHPDLLRVTRLTRKEIEKKERSRLATQDPEAAEGDLGNLILVDQIRALNGLIGLRPRQGRRRVFVIDPADRMNREAQNSLLKTLEEPPERSVLILVSSRPHLLLPTVRSRCFSLGFSSMPSAELARLLGERGMSKGEAGARAALAGGAFGAALALDLETRRERRQEVYDMLEALACDPRRSVEKLPAMAAALAGKDPATLTDGLDLAQGLLRDAARTTTAGAGLMHVDLEQGLGRLGRSLGPARAAELVAGVEKLRGDMRLNVNRTLIAETLLAAVAGGPLP